MLELPETPRWERLCKCDRPLLKNPGGRTNRAKSNPLALHPRPSTKPRFLSPLFSLRILRLLLEPWFPNSRVHRKHQEDLIKQIAAPHPRSFCFGRSGVVPRELGFSTSSQVMPMLLVWDYIWRTIRPLHICFLCQVLAAVPRLRPLLHQWHPSHQVLPQHCAVEHELHS